MKMRLVASLLLGAVGLSGCGIGPQSDNRWVSNSQERMFTRIPKSWKTFTINPYKVDASRPTPLQRSTSRWSMILDSAKDANLTTSRIHLNEEQPANVVGEMSVQPLPSDWKVQDSNTLREDLSASVMRQFAFNETATGQKLGDPVKKFLDGDPSVEIIANTDIARKNGLHGSHLRLNFEVATNKWITIDQNILVDRDTQKLYRLIIKCESQCFKTNYNEVKRISDSWTVRK